jgi:hypothetical protein
LETFDRLKAKLQILEEKHYQRILAAFSWSNRSELISGGVQFGALDHSQRKSTKKLPVVCVIGINYSQQKMQADTNNLFPYQGGYHDLVAFYTGCYEPTAHVIAAYNRNKTSWENPPPIVVPRSPSGRYGSVNATDKCQLLATDYEQLLVIS